MCVCWGGVLFKCAHLECVSTKLHMHPQKKRLLELRLHSYAAQPMRSPAFMLSRLSKCDKSVLKLRDCYPRHRFM